MLRDVTHESAPLARITTEDGRCFHCGHIAGARCVCAQWGNCSENHGRLQQTGQLVAVGQQVALHTSAMLENLLKVLRGEKGEDA